MPLLTKLSEVNLFIMMIAMNMYIFKELKSSVNERLLSWGFRMTDAQSNFLFRTSTRRYGKSSPMAKWRYNSKWTTPAIRRIWATSGRCKPATSTSRTRRTCWPRRLQKAWCSRLAPLPQVSIICLTARCRWTQSTTGAFSKVGRWFRLVHSEHARNTAKVDSIHVKKAHTTVFVLARFSWSRVGCTIRAIFLYENATRTKSYVLAGPQSQSKRFWFWRCK